MDEMLRWGLGPAVVISLRLLVPLTIFRWPLYGGFASNLFDGFDVMMIKFINSGYIIDYARIDKALDWYFLLFMAVVSLRWASIEKWTSLGLFGWRTVGVILLEITGARWLLVIFPNLFLDFWLANALRLKFFPQWTWTIKRMITALLILLIPKLLTEYMLHVALYSNPLRWVQSMLA
jgi:hypothetical protein